MNLFFSNKKHKGSSTILVILISLALMIFGVLGFMMTYSSYRISQKNAQATNEYYLLDAKAQIFLSELDKKILSNLNGKNLDISKTLIDLSQEEPDGLYIDGKAAKENIYDKEQKNSAKIEKYIKNKENKEVFYIELDLMEKSLENGGYYKINSYRRLPENFEYQDGIKYGQGEVIAID